MNPRERGFLLLSSRLGNPERKILTAHQLGILADRMGIMEKPVQDRNLQTGDLAALGYSRDMARRIVSLLEEEALLDYYCAGGARAGCVPVTRVSSAYPPLLRRRLGQDSPGCFWARGDISLLQNPAIALVGSRDLGEENRRFARAVGRMAAQSGFVLVSGNARGADREAQEACLAAGGQVLSIVADELNKQPSRENVLYLSEDGYAEPFSAQRALSRNRCIHALGQVTFVAQATLHKGGSWDGAVKNLRHGWSGVICCRDGSEASRELERLGAYLLDRQELGEFSLEPLQQSLFDE